MQQKLNRAAQILAKTFIPDLPEELTLLQEELGKEHPNSVTVANLIGHNPQLLGDFLALANTSATGQNTEIKDAKTAVNLLGMDEIQNLYLATSLLQLPLQNNLENNILHHGAQAGLAAAELAYWVYDVSRSEAYLAGLMQNIGALYLSRIAPIEYESLFQNQLSNPIKGIQKEEHYYQTTHMHVGAFICRKWGIRPNIYKAALLHHDPDYIPKTVNDAQTQHLTALIMVANYAVVSADKKQYISQELRQYRNLGLQALNLPDNAMQAAVAAVRKWGNSAGTAPVGH